MRDPVYTYIYIYIRRPAGPDIVLLVKFRTDLERLSRIFDGHLYLVQREREAKRKTRMYRAGYERSFLLRNG